MTRMRWFAFVMGLLLGVLIILAIRLFTYDPPHTHYHANFAVYINGQREEFNNPKYYQEVAICSADNDNLPQQRAHMHDNINSVVHVHDSAVTWGQFFDNIGWEIGPNFIMKDDGTLLVASGDNQLHILLNGQDYTGLTSIANRVIGDRDRLLVSFGNIDNPQLQQEYTSVPSTAKHYDESTDPASCAGAENPTFSERLHHLF